MDISKFRSLDANSVFNRPPHVRRGPWIRKGRTSTLGYELYESLEADVYLCESIKHDPRRPTDSITEGVHTST